MHLKTKSFWRARKNFSVSEFDDELISLYQILASFKAAKSKCKQVIVHFIWDKRKVCNNAQYKKCKALLKYELFTGIVTDCTGDEFMIGQKPKVGTICPALVKPNIYFQYFFKYSFYTTLL